MMANRKEDGSSQVEEGDHSRDPSEPTDNDLNALQEGIREGLKEGHTVEDAPQDSVGP